VLLTKTGNIDYGRKEFIVRLRLTQLIMFVIMTGCATGFATSRSERQRTAAGPAWPLKTLNLMCKMQCSVLMTDSTVQPALVKQRKEPPAASR